MTNAVPAHEARSVRPGRAIRAATLIALFGAAPPLFADDIPGVMQVRNQIGKTLTAKMMPSVGEDAQAKLTQGATKAFSFEPDADCGGQTVDYEIRFINSTVNRLHASGSFDLVGAPDENGECVMQVKKPSMNVPDYNHQLVWTKVSATKGRLTFGYRGGE